MQATALKAPPGAIRTGSPGSPPPSATFAAPPAPRPAPAAHRRYAPAIRLAAALLLAALGSTAPAQARELAGVQLPESQQIADTPLHCNGAGLRTRFFVKVYVAALYSAAPRHLPAELLDDPAPRRLSLILLRDLAADSVPGAVRDGLARVLDEQARQALSGPIRAFGDILDGLPALRRGERLDLDFGADGIALSLDGKLRGRVADPRLSRALLAIWLGEDPVDGDLKTALLGG